MSAPLAPPGSGISPAASQQIAQLVALLTKHVLGSSSAAGQADLSALSSNISRELLLAPSPGASISEQNVKAEGLFDRLEHLLIASGSRSEDDLLKFRTLRRRLMTAGEPGSALAEYRQKGSLLDLLVSLARVETAGSASTVAAGSFSSGSTAAAFGQVPERPALVSKNETELGAGGRRFGEAAAVAGIQPPQQPQQLPAWARPVVIDRTTTDSQSASTQVSASSVNPRAASGSSPAKTGVSSSSSQRAAKDKAAEDDASCAVHTPHHYPPAAVDGASISSSSSSSAHTQHPLYSTASAVDMLPSSHEAALVGDLVYVLQGVDGRYVRWDDKNQIFKLHTTPATPSSGPLTSNKSLLSSGGSVGLAEELVVSEGAIQQVAMVSEVGWLARVIGLRLQSHPPSSTAPAVAFDGAPAAPSDGNSYSTDGGSAAVTQCRRAFHAALQLEMDGYYKALAALDADIGSSSSSSSSKWSLRRLLSWAQEWLPRLKLMAVALDDTAGVDGAGALVSILHSLCYPAGPSGAFTQPAAVHALGCRLLGRTCGPLLTMTYAWLLSGELPSSSSSSSAASASMGAVDAAIEDALIGASGHNNTSYEREANPEGFFVAARRNVPAAKLWSDRFYLDTVQLPSFLPASLASAILDIGKSVHFIRHSCGDSAWVAEQLSKVVLEVASRQVPLPSAAISAANTSLAAVKEANAAAAELHQHQHASGRHAANAASTSSSASDSACYLTASSVAPCIEQQAKEYKLLASLNGPDVTGCHALSCFVNSVSPLVHARLLDLLYNRHSIEKHLRAIQRYVLLSQGDFVSVLVAAIADELDKPASALTVSLHHLEALVEGAIRSSNAQHEDKEVLRRLCVRLLTPSPGDVGWDVFTLHYELTPPLSSVVTPECQTVYARLFHYLFTVRRVEHKLSSTWASHMSAWHSLRALKHRGLTGALHVANLLRTDMNNFIGNLLSYSTCEVLATGWQRLCAEMNGESLPLIGGSAPTQALTGPSAASASSSSVSAGVTTFDELSGAHERYLYDLMDRALLSPRTATVFRPLSSILQECLRFCGLQAAMVEAAQEQAALRKAAEEEIAARTKAGGWGMPVGGSIADDMDALDARIAAALDDIVAAYGPRIADVAAVYRARMAEFLDAVEAASAVNDGLEELQGLLMRFDFNDFYLQQAQQQLMAMSMSINNNNTAVAPGGEGSDGRD